MSGAVPRFGRLPRKDLDEPGLDRRPAGEIFQASIGANERFLHQILGVLPISRQRLRDTKEHAGVAIDQRVKRVIVAAACGPDQLQVARILHNRRLPHTPAAEPVYPT